MEKTMKTTSRNETALRLAEVIETRRKELHITRAILADRSGLSRSTITRIAQGFFAKPTPDSLRAIAEAIDLPCDELFAIAGWLSTRQSRAEPFVRVSYHGVPREAIEEIEAAIDAVAARYRRCFRHDCVVANHRHK
ncbi:hypothetical protein NG2371_01810 [Nocardia gamkensis]|nr:hypothetical protein [Nocardia gamkensis]